MFAYDRLDLGLSLMNSEPGVAKSRSSENSISDTDNRSSTKTNDSNNIFKHTHTIENCFHFPIGNWKPVSPSPTTSIRFPATAKDDGFSEDFIAEYQKDLDIPKTYSSERAVELKLLQLASHRYKKRCPTDGSSQRNQEK
uniref:Homeobox domain-containing protein n=1 Tax=Caenorhabditis tropicalis TaxID=1561998 RepID=A0A1I7TZ52_9PELO